MNQDFNVLLEYIGWGEPHGALWFIGLEESEGSNESEIQELRTTAKRELNVTYKPPSALSNKKSELKLIHRYESRIASARSVSNSDPDAYARTKLWESGAKTFHCNLWPLGRRKTNEWVAEKRFDMMALEEYKRRCRVTRFKNIHEFHKHCEPLATICCGKGAWQDFKDCLRISEATWIDANGRRISISDVNKTILAYHWNGYRKKSGILKEEDAKLIVERLKYWNVSLP